MTSRTYDLHELQRLDEKCRAAAADLGLEVPEIVFHLAPAEQIYDIAARGLPGRYSHWRFGQGYERMKLAHDHGQSRIYELVLNTQPFQAYLLEGNSWVAQLLVIAHVYGHCWFFANNRHFEQADRKFLHRIRAAAERIEDYARHHGRVAVEDFIDSVQALALHCPIEPLRPGPATPPPALVEDAYADLFPDEAARRRAEHDRAHDEWHQRFPHEPESDLLAFVLRHAPRLEDWQRDVISIMREEATYFMPQRRTKIANEGFASWTHMQIVQAMNLDTDEFVEFDRLNASVVQPHLRSVNPYNVGVELWREVVRIYDEPTDEEREKWPGAGEIGGRERLLEVASVVDDAALVAEFLTPAVCERAKLFAWERDPERASVLRVTSREADEVRATLLRELWTLGIPRIVVTDADVFHQGGLWLQHCAEDAVGLDPEYAAGTLPHVARLWGRAVTLEGLERHEDTTRPVWYQCLPGDESATPVYERPTANLDRRKG